MDLKFHLCNPCNLTKLFRAVSSSMSASLPLWSVIPLSLIRFALPLCAEEGELDELVVTAESIPAAAGFGASAMRVGLRMPDATTAALGSVLETMPGMTAGGGFGVIDPPRVSIRGSGIQSAPTQRGFQLFQLGMPLQLADGSFNISLLEPSWARTATLARGTAAGVPHLGGALALGTPDDVFAPAAHLRVATGSHGHYDFGLGGVIGNLSMRGSASGGDGWRPQSSWQREAALLAWRVPLEAAGRMPAPRGPGVPPGAHAIEILFFASHPQFDVPGPLTKSNALNSPKSILPAVARDRPRRDTRHTQLHLAATLRDDATARFAITGGLIDHHDTFVQLLPNGISDTRARDAYLATEGTLFTPGDGALTAALMIQGGQWHMDRFRNDNGANGQRIGDLRLRPMTFTARLDHHQPLGRGHAIDLGISLSGAHRPIDDRLQSPTPIDLSYSGTRPAPRACWSWRAAEQLTLALSASRSYEPPTYSDLIFPTGPPNARTLQSAALGWQRADTLELAGSGRHNAFSYTTAIFHSWWDGELLRLSDASGSPLGTVNAGRTIHRGIETTVAWQPPANGGTAMAVRATHTYLDARFRDDPAFGDRRLGGTTPHTGWIEARATTPEGWFVAPSVTWQSGTTFADHAGNLGYSRGALWSLEAGRRHPGDGWAITCGIHNLLDRRTISGTAGVLDTATNPAGSAIFLPHAGRTWHLALSRDW